MNDQPVRLEDGGYTWAGTTFPIEPQLTRLINDCRTLEVGESGAVILALYHYSLMLRFHSKFIPIRTVHEVWVASYNPVVLLAWQANMELELVLHTPVKLFRYVAKGSRQQSLKAAISELGRRNGKGDERAAERLEEAIEAGKREVPMAEALIRLDSTLSLSTSFPTKVAWVNTALGEGGQVIPAPNLFFFSEELLQLNNLLCSGALHPGEGEVQEEERFLFLHLLWPVCDEVSRGSDRKRGRYSQKL